MIVYTLQSRGIATSLGFLAASRNEARSAISTVAIPRYIHRAGAFNKLKLRLDLMPRVRNYWTAAAATTNCTRLVQMPKLIFIRLQSSLVIIIIIIFFNEKLTIATHYNR